jgi:hypothetical protein
MADKTLRLNDIGRFLGGTPVAEPKMPERERMVSRVALEEGGVFGSQATTQPPTGNAPASPSRLVAS